MTTQTDTPYPPEYPIGHYYEGLQAELHLLRTRCSEWQEMCEMQAEEVVSLQRQLTLAQGAHDACVATMVVLQDRHDTLVEERDQARGIAVGLEQELAFAADVAGCLAEVICEQEEGLQRDLRWWETAGRCLMVQRDCAQDDLRDILTERDAAHLEVATLRRTLADADAAIASHRAASTAMRAELDRLRTVVPCQCKRAKTIREDAR